MKDEHAGGAAAPATRPNGEGQRERIVRVAAGLFARQGYDATSVAEIGGAVGLGKGALYHHIQSKEELLYRINITQVERLEQFAEEVLTWPGTAAEKVQSMARALMRNIADHSAEWRVFFREVGSLTGERRERVMRARSEYERTWATLFQQGAADGSLRPIEPVFVKGVLGMFNYSYIWLDREGPLSPEEIADVFVESLMTGLAPEPRPSE